MSDWFKHLTRLAHTRKGAVMDKFNAESAGLRFAGEQPDGPVDGDVFDERIAAECGDVFRSLFNSTQSLDILPLVESSELQLQTMCRPFYDVSSA